MKHIIKLLALIAPIILLIPSTGMAQSIFGAGGIGELRYLANIRSAAIGGSGIALVDPIAQNHLNPAAWGYLRYVSYGIGVRFEGVNNERSTQNSTSEESGLNDISFALNTKGSLTFAGGFKPHSDNDFKVLTKTDVYERLLEVTGGTSLGYFGFGYSFGERVLIGAQYNYVFGTDDEQWNLDFSQFNNVNISDVAIRSTRQKRGYGYTLGTIFRFFPQVQIGAVYMSEAKLDTKLRESDTAGNAGIEEQFDITIPHSFGIGLVSELSPAVLFAADIYSWQYEDLDLSAPTTQIFNNSTRYSAGFEFGNRETEIRTIARGLKYRIGGYYWQLYNTDVDGTAVTEKFITAGFGYPFNGGGTRLDVAFEGGFRESESGLLGKDKVARLFVGIVGAEVWFRRVMNR